MTALPDPCPLPGKQRKKGLNDKERLVYAPMADVGGLLFDKDAVYIDLPDWKVTLAVHSLMHWVSGLQPSSACRRCQQGGGSLKAGHRGTTGCAW